MLANSIGNQLKRLSLHRKTSAARRHTLTRRLMFDQLEPRALLASNVLGDFNNDGADDMAIGVPREMVSGHVNAGAVNVIYGGAGTGLSSRHIVSGNSRAENQLWTQDSYNTLDAAENDDLFGASLAAGDFNNDGLDDLAIGVPGESVNGVAKAGAVHVLYGYPFVLTFVGQQFWSQDSSGILNSAGATASGDGEQFGFSLVSGDFNNDGADDLAIGVPNESSLVSYGGAVNVIYGATGVGLTSSGNQIWHQDSSGVRGVTDANEHFGFAVATGDFNNDGTDDLAVGAPGDVVGGISNAGGVNIIHGSTTGLSSNGNYLFTQNSSGVRDVAEVDDAFGSSLAVGNFDGDLQDDLAIGVPREDIGTTADAGAVNVLYGGNREFELGAAGATQLGLTAAGNQFWSQDSSGILDTAEGNSIPGGTSFGDSFGASLTAGDFNGDLRDDLAIGVPGESAGSIFGSGAVNVIMGNAAGLNSAGNQFWTQDRSRIQGVAESGDLFGAAVSVGDFNADGKIDLAIAAPGQKVESNAFPGTFIASAGVIHAIYGSVTGLKSSGNQLWSQNSSGILGESSEGEYLGDALLGSMNLSYFAFVF